MSTAKPLIAPITPKEITSMMDEMMPCPTIAMIFHTGQYRLRMVTAHRISNNDINGGYAIEPGRILTPEDEAEITQLLLFPEDDKDIEIYPEHLLTHGRHSVAWYVPAARRPMLLMKKDSSVIELDVIWPNLVFHAVCGELRVASFIGGRPDAQTVLFHAPLANIFADTRLCLGSAKMPSTSRIVDIPACEAAMFESAFTHQNHHGAIVPSKKGGSLVVSSDPMEVWPELDGGETPFPEENLSPLGMNLREWLRGGK